jgi:hypothetical protein
MKSIVKIIAVILLAGVASITAKAQSTKQESAVPTTHTMQTDTLKKQFNRNKSNTVRLASRQTAAALLTYYEWYLQEKDWNRADTLLNTMLRTTNTVSMKYQLSLVAYKYTGDTKRELLFLKDTGKVTEYRSYFSTVKVSALKSNADKWVHYYNLVALDSAYHQVSPDSLEQVKMAKHYNSLAWNSILNQKLDHVGYYLDQSMKYDPKSKDPYANRPLLLLLQGKYQEAEKLYIKYKDQPFDGPDFSFKDEFLVDFKELAAVGVTNKDITRITELLNKK